MSEDIQAELERIAIKLTALANQVDSVANDLLSIKTLAQQQTAGLRRQEESADKPAEGNSKQSSN
jgi:hypothetical protein